MNEIPQAAIDAAAYAFMTYGHASPGNTTTVAGVDVDIARVMLRAARPHLVAAERELLAESEKALWACAKAFLTVEPTLKQPYPDDQRWSPWTRWCERPARRAHDLHIKIRRHLRASQDWKNAP